MRCRRREGHTEILDRIHLHTNLLISKSRKISLENQAELNTIYNLISSKKSDKTRQEEISTAIAFHYLKHFNDMRNENKSLFVAHERERDRFHFVLVFITSLRNPQISFECFEPFFIRVFSILIHLFLVSCVFFTPACFPASLITRKIFLPIHPLRYSNDRTFEFQNTKFLDSKTIHIFLVI